MGFASQFELVSNGRVGEHWCFGKFQSLSDCRYGFYAGIMIPKYGGVHSVVIVGRTSCAGFWVGCWQCHSADTSGWTIAGVVPAEDRVFGGASQQSGGKRGRARYCGILGQVLIVIGGNRISIIGISSRGMDADSCGGIDRVSAAVVVVFVGIIVSGSGIAVADR